MLSNLEMLLLDAPIGRHFAQLSGDPQVRLETTSLFIETGLRRGNGVVALASAEEVERLREHLGRRNLDLMAYRSGGQLALHDAEEVLGRFMRGNRPDWPRFRSTIGSILEGAQRFGRSTVRVYGEMVGILWAGGRVQPAILLEEYWNLLAREFPFSLFCRYFLDPFDEASYAGPLDGIGRTHSDILVTQADGEFGAVLDTLIRDTFGISMSEMIRPGPQGSLSHPNLPAARRAVLWIKRNDPARVAHVLAQARRHYLDPLKPSAPTPTSSLGTGAS